MNDKRKNYLEIIVTFISVSRTTGINTVYEIFINYPQDFTFYSNSNCCFIIGNEQAKKNDGFS